MKFCENALCVFHLEAGDNNRLRHALAAEQVEVRQYTIVDTATGNRFRLCEVCCNAVALVNENKSRKESGIFASIQAEGPGEVVKNEACGVQAGEKKESGSGAREAPSVDSASSEGSEG